MLVKTFRCSPRSWNINIITRKNVSVFETSCLAHACLFLLIFFLFKMAFKSCLQTTLFRNCKYWPPSEGICFILNLNMCSSTCICITQVPTYNGLRSYIFSVAVYMHVTSISMVLTAFCWKTTFHQCRAFFCHQTLSGAHIMNVAT